MRGPWPAVKLGRSRFTCKVKKSWGSLRFTQRHRWPEDVRATRHQTCEARVTETQISEPGSVGSSWKNLDLSYCRTLAPLRHSSECHGERLAQRGRPVPAWMMPFQVHHCATLRSTVPLKVIVAICSYAVAGMAKADRVHKCAHHGDLARQIALLYTIWEVVTIVSVK